MLNLNKQNYIIVEDYEGKSHQICGTGIYQIKDNAIKELERITAQRKHYANDCDGMPYMIAHGWSMPYLIEIKFEKCEVSMSSTPDAFQNYQDELYKQLNKGENKQ